MGGSVSERDKNVLALSPVRIGKARLLLRDDVCRTQRDAETGKGCNPGRRPKHVRGKRESCAAVCGEARGHPEFASEQELWRQARVRLVTGFRERTCRRSAGARVADQGGRRVLFGGPDAQSATDE